MSTPNVYPSAFSSPNGSKRMTALRRPAPISITSKSASTSGRMTAPSAFTAYTPPMLQPKPSPMFTGVPVNPLMLQLDHLGKRKHSLIGPTLMNKRPMSQPGNMFQRVQSPFDGMPLSVDSVFNLPPRPSSIVHDVFFSAAPSEHEDSDSHRIESADVSIKQTPVSSITSPLFMPIADFDSLFGYEMEPDHSFEEGVAQLKSLNEGFRLGSSVTSSFLASSVAALENKAVGMDDVYGVSLFSQSDEEDVLPHTMYQRTPCDSPDNSQYDTSTLPSLVSPTTTSESIYSLDMPMVVESVSVFGVSDTAIDCSFIEPRRTARPTIFETLTASNVDWCRYCGTTEGVNWRPGPWGKRTLCNKHGCDYKGYGFACKLPRLDLTGFAHESIHERERPVLQLFCTVCQDSNSYIDNMLVRCEGCPKSFHQKCCPTGEISEDFVNSCEPWFCAAGCSDNQSKRRIVVELPRKRLPLMCTPKNTPENSALYSPKQRTTSGVNTEKSKSTRTSSRKSPIRSRMVDRMQTLTPPVELEEQKSPRRRGRPASRKLAHSTSDYSMSSLRSPYSSDEE
jgi:hypothetical protein